MIRDRAPLGVAALALALRLLHLRFAAKLLLADDAEFFEQHARQFLDAWSAIGTSHFWPLLRIAVDESSLQGVLYPFFESLVYWGAGGVLHEALAVVQVVLGTVTAWLTCLTARRAFGSPAGLAAGLLAALYPPLIAATGQLLAETLLTSIQAAALYLLIRGVQENRTRGRGSGWGALALGGSGIGLLMLRPAFQYAGVLLLVALTVAALVVNGVGFPTPAGDKPPPYSGRFAQGGSRGIAVAQVCGAYLLGVMVVAVPWVLANGLVYGQFTWSRTGDAWHQVYWGIYPPNHGWWPPDSPVPPKYGVESLPGARSAGVQIEERDVDYLWAAVDQVRATPLKAFATEVNKLYQGYLHPSNTYGEQLPLLGALAVPLHRLLVLFALAGLSFGWVRQQWGAAWCVIAVGGLASALPFLASHIDLRYTIPPSQVASIFAGAAVALSYRAAREKLATWHVSDDGGSVGARHHPSAGRVPAPLPERTIVAGWLARRALTPVAAVLPLFIWTIDVSWLLLLTPDVPPWTLHLAHTMAMCVAFLFAGLSAAALLRGHSTCGGARRAFLVGGVLLGGFLGTVYGTQAVYEGDWHQWTVRLRPGDAVRQRFELPSGWSPPAGGRAEVRLYVAGPREATYEPVVRVNQQTVARLGPGLSDTGPLRFWEKIMVAARNQGLVRAEVAQWIAVPVELSALRQPQVEVEVVVERVAEARSGSGGLTLWGDYSSRPGLRLYEGPAVYSRIQGQDEAFLKFIATGEYGIWRWQRHQSVAIQAARAHGDGWETQDLSDTAPGRQTGEYRIRLLVYAANGDLAALF